MLADFSSKVMVIVCCRDQTEVGNEEISVAFQQRWGTIHTVLVGVLETLARR